MIEAWLKGSAGEEDDLESKRFLHDLTSRALDAADANNDPIFTISLPEAPRARRPIERLLAPLNLPTTDHRVSIDAPTYLRHVEQTHAVPVMPIDLVERTVRLAIGGQLVNRCEPLPDPTVVDGALAHLENYVATVDWGQSLDPQFAKASMFEALLYLLASPFAHEQMKARRQAYALVDSRGPQVLYIFGPAQNGKSTFVRFALQLLTGRHVSALAGSQLTKSRVRDTSSLGTVFPLIFDDVDASRKGRELEEILKSYWEHWWREECPAPQIAITSNTGNLKDWAKSRIKRIDFDVHFAPTASRKAELNRILVGQFA